MYYHSNHPLFKPNNHALFPHFEVYPIQVTLNTLAAPRLNKDPKAAGLRIRKETYKMGPYQF